MSQPTLQMSNNLITYCQGFAHSTKDWPTLPLKSLPELDWWQELGRCSANGAGQGLQLLRTLENSLPQLLLPQVDGISGSERGSEGAGPGEERGGVEGIDGEHPRHG